MGMAASQARYLALVARKSNCEYEGQQINQARTVLSNQSANLFNQMLGLNVPIPPSTQDFTKTQYSFSDGVNKVTMDKWDQLATPEEDYNYVVTYHYNANVYTGSQKKLNDPQVQFSGALPADTSSYAAQIASIQEAMKNVTEMQKNYDEAFAKYKTRLSQASKLTTYSDINLRQGVTNHTYDAASDTYTVDIGDTVPDLNNDGYEVYEKDGATPYYKKDGMYYTSDGTNYTVVLSPDLTDYALKTKEEDASYTYVGYDKVTDATVKQQIADAIELLKSYGALDASKFKASDVYYDADSQTIAFKSDLDSLISTSSAGSGTSRILNSYHLSGATPEGENWISIDAMKAEIDELKDASDKAATLLEIAKASLDATSIPNYIGNCKLTALSELSNSEMAEIAQIIRDMEAQDVHTNLTKCFDTLDQTYDISTYSGGIYTFTMNGNTYFTTYYDLADTALSGEGINNIDAQQKLPYYRADYIEQKIEKTEKALLQTDGNGRFNSIKLGDDTINYTLEMETITDDVAYKDAMNKYYYESAIYDKMIQDINAKTSLIHQEDQQLELRLKQLDTEQNALSTEIDAVSKVVKDNVEKSFKTFGG